MPAPVVTSTPAATASKSFPDLPALAKHLREELQSKKFVLLYAYNGTGKTGCARRSRMWARGAKNGILFTSTPLPRICSLGQ